MLCFLRQRVWYDVVSVEVTTRSLRYVQTPRYDTNDAGLPTEIHGRHSALRRLAQFSSRALARLVNASGSDGSSPNLWGRTYPTHRGRVTIRPCCRDRMPSSEHRLMFPKPGNIDADNLPLVKSTAKKAHTSNKMANNDLPVPRDPTEDEALALFKTIEERFPSQTLGDDKWYILTVS